MKKLVLILLISTQVFAGLDAKSGKVINVATPTASTDAATKQYVDDTSAAAGHNLLSVAHGDTTTDTVTRGSLIYGNSTPAWDELVLGASGTILRSDGTDASWAATTNITTLGTIVTGTWQATDVGVAYGGTGASSLNDLITLTTHTAGNYAAGDAEAGNALTGDTATAFFSAGTIEHEYGGLETDISAIANGDFIVGTGVGTLGLESGATARTSMGLGSIATQNANAVAITGGAWDTAGTIDSVTIGGTTPAAGTFTDITIPSGGGNFYTLTGTLTDDTTASALFLFGKRKKTTGGYLANNTTMTEFRAHGWNDAGSDYIEVGGIRIQSDGQHQAGEFPSKILFRTTNVGTTVAIRWTIDSSGDFLPYADDTYDIGSSALSVGKGYFDDDLTLGGVLYVNTAGASRFIVSSIALTSTVPLKISDKVIFTQADGDEYIDSLADGYMDYGATTGHRFNNNVELHGTAECRFYDNGNYVGFEAPALSADQIWVLPTADGNADEIIKTDGSGTLSFVRMPKAIYAQLSDSTDQTFGATGTAQSITFNTNDEIAGITHSTSSNPENITIVTTGLYNIVAQPQVAAGSGASDDYFHMWLQKDTNGGFVDISNSNVELTLSTNDEDVILLNAIVSLNAGDIIRVRSSVGHTNIELDAQTPGSEPAIPSIIFSMFMIGT